MKTPVDSPTYCSLLWSHVAVRPNGDLKPCCRFEASIPPARQKETYAQTFASEEFESLRRAASEGIRIPGCRRCYAEEDAGAQSMRQSQNELHASVATDIPKITSVEFAFGNLCNLKCRSCDSQFSSRWISDEKRLSLKRRGTADGIQKNPLSALDDSMDHLEHIKLIGGEPLMEPNHEVFIKRLSSRKDLENISLDYATNGTQKVSQDVLNFWSKVKSICLTFSIDGLKNQNDYIRHGSDWQTLIDNIHWFQKNMAAHNRTLLIHTVVSIYNVHSLIEIDRWLSKEFPDILLMKDCLVHPEWLGINNLPATEKKDLLQIYTQEIARTPLDPTWYKHICHYLQKDPTSSFEAFIDMDRKLSSIRDEKLNEERLLRLIDAH